MATPQESTLAAWKQVNAVTASMDLTGAAPAFRQAIAETDFTKLTPGWQFGNFDVHVLDWLEGVMVYADPARKIAVVGRHLWTIMNCDHKAMEMMVRDLMDGAAGVKLIDYNSGPYRDAGRAWRRYHEDLQPQQDLTTTLESQLQALLARATAVKGGTDRSSEQYQVLYSELAAAAERHAELAATTARLGALLETAQDAVANV